MENIIYNYNQSTFNYAVPQIEINNRKACEIESVWTK